MTDTMATILGYAPAPTGPRLSFSNTPSWAQLKALAEMERKGVLSETDRPVLEDALKRGLVPTPSVQMPTQAATPRAGIQVVPPVPQEEVTAKPDIDGMLRELEGNDSEPLAAAAAARKAASGRRDQALGQSGNVQASGVTADQFKEAARRAYADGNADMARRFIAYAKEAEAAEAASGQNLPPAPADVAEFSRAALAGENPPFEPLPAPIPRENEWLGGVMPSPRQAMRNLKENVFTGDSDPTTLNRGETVAAALNKAGESMTMGIVGDEAAGAIDAALGRGNAADRTQFYREQERQLWEQHPGVALGAEIGGALIGPGKGAGAFINAGKGTAARMGRAALASGAAGATYGAMEGENPDERTLGAALGLGAGMAGGAALTGIGQGFLRAAQAVKGHPALKEAIPTLEGLKESSQALFRAVEQSGATLPQAQASGLSKTLATTMAKEGYHPRLHPKVGVILDEVASMSKGPVSMQQVMQLRRIAGGVAKSLEPDERRLANIAKDAIDTAMDGLPHVSDKMKNARDLWGRMRRLELIETMIDDASRETNFEKALQSKARSLLRNGGKKLRGFSEGERQAIARIAKGGALQRSLDHLGKRLSPTSLTGMAAAGGSFAYGGPVLGTALAGTGLAAKAISNALIRGSAKNARNAVAMAPERQAIIQALLRRQNPLARTAPLPGQMAIEAVNR